MSSLRKSVKRLLPDWAVIARSFYMSHGRLPRIRNPLTFSDLIARQMLTDRNPLMTRCADKYLVRSYVHEIIGEAYLVPLIADYSTADEIVYHQLPDEFVLKGNHGSGMNLIVTPETQVSEPELKEQAAEWLKIDFYQFHREWAYKHIQPHLTAEQFLKADDGQPPNDYKFYVFDGKALFLHVDFERFASRSRTLYDLQGTALNVTYHHPMLRTDPISGVPLDKMVELAERLAKPFKFVRVDFYFVSGKIFFSELTFYPGAALERFNPQAFDSAIIEAISNNADLASHWRLRSSTEPLSQ